MFLKYIKMLKVLIDVIWKVKCSLDMMGKNVLEKVCMMKFNEV